MRLSSVLITFITALNKLNESGTAHAFMISSTSLSKKTIDATATTTTPTTIIMSSTSPNIQEIQPLNGETDTKTNDEEEAVVITMNEKIEKIRQDSMNEYEEAMDYFMFELGNDIVLLSNQNDVSSYIQNQFDTIVFDCDGVLYRGGNVPIPECGEALQYLVKQEKQILFLTNNAEYSREQLCTKLTSILVDDNDNDNDKPILTKEQMITSSYSTAKYLEKNLLNDKESEDCNIYVIGSNGLCDEIQKSGFNVLSASSIAAAANAASSSMDRTELASYTFEKEEGNDNKDAIDAIVVGLDTDFNYRKLCIVTSLLQRHPNALFIATNEDAFDVVDGTTTSSSSSSGSKQDIRNLPGNGSIVKPIEIASQRTAINVGKPSQVLGDLLQSEYNLDYKRTLMVGDRLDTDIKFGKDSGMKSALVLTGCTDSDKLRAVGVGTDEEPLPHILFPHVGMMLGSQ